MKLSIVGIRILLALIASMLIVTFSHAQTLLPEQGCGSSTPHAVLPVR